MIYIVYYDLLFLLLLAFQLPRIAIVIFQYNCVSCDMMRNDNNSYL